MSWESPIHIFEQQLQASLENEILTAVRKVHVEVDKEELLRALQYDRDQYDRGYEDGKRDSVVQARWDRRDESYCCTNCGAEAIHHDLSEETVAWYMTRHCPDCGARMDAGVSE
jgi:DNA-directed RNA polymerase subunit RPC12/RpoP